MQSWKWVTAGRISREVTNNLDLNSNNSQVSLFACISLNSLLCAVHVWDSAPGPEMTHTAAPFSQQNHSWENLWQFVFYDFKWQHLLATFPWASSDSKLRIVIHVLVQGPSRTEHNPLVQQQWRYAVCTVGGLSCLLVSKPGCECSKWWLRNGCSYTSLLQVRHKHPCV